VVIECLEVIPECLYLSFTVLRGGDRVFIGGYRECLEVVIECLEVLQSVCTCHSQC